MPIRTVHLTRLMISAALLALLACTPRASIPNSTGISSGIIHGSDATAADSFAKSVVGIATRTALDGLVLHCTGTLIGPHTVLTAAHCLDGFSVDLLLTFGLDATRAPVTTVRLNQFAIHEHYQEFAPAGTRDIADIGIAHFDDDLPPGYAPAIPLVMTDLLKNGSVVLIVGFGVNRPLKPTEDSETAAGAGILRSANVTIQDVSFSNTEIMTDERMAGSCAGDSGGPIFLMIDGTIYLWGVTSRGDDSCSTDGVYTRVEPYNSWIREHTLIFNAAHSIGTR